MHDEWIDLDSGVRLHVVRYEPEDRTEVPWLLVHGLASNAHLWDGVGHSLAERGHPVVAVDLRGHGLSSKPDDGYDMATVVGDVVALLDRLGWSDPAVAGQSWGGNLVLELAHQRPDLVSLVACVDGGFIDLQGRFPDWADCARELAPPRLAGTPLVDLEHWLREAHPTWPEDGRRGTLANFEVRDDGTVAPWLTFDRHLAVLRGLWEHRPSTLYPAMQVPVVLVAADTGDAAWTTAKDDAVAAAVAALPRGRAVWFRPADHDVHAQHPVAVADLLHDASHPEFFAEPERVATRRFAT